MFLYLLYHAPIGNILSYDSTSFMSVLCSDYSTILKVVTYVNILPMKQVRAEFDIYIRKIEVLPHVTVFDLTLVIVVPVTVIIMVE